ncbi:unnamed protein product [Cochlearia groenlandica]
MEEIEAKSDAYEETKPKRRREIISDEDDDGVVLDREFKRTLLCVAKPSYLLGLGTGSSTRREYINRLVKILKELLRYRNYREASGVLSVLMQGTMRDCSPKMNRLKYEAQIKLVNHLEHSKNKAKEIGQIYDTWIGRIGKKHKEEKLVVWFDQICHFIEHGMKGEAHSAAISMMQNRDLAMLSRSNLFIGITFYKFWFSKLKELQPKDEDCIESVSNMSESRSDNMLEDPVREESVYSAESGGSVRYESESSVMNYKRLSHMSISDSGIAMDVKVKRESPQRNNNPPQLYATSEENEAPLRDGADYDPDLIKILWDMDPWLLPLKPPEDPDCYRKIVTDSFYKEAVRYLRVAMQSTRHVTITALHPLVQLLLIGGHVDEAMKVVDEVCNKVHHINAFRIKALMMEKFHTNIEELAKCYEDILNIDPCCVTTVKKLVLMCIEDGYSRESLIEMIALHVEASSPEPEIWKEFAICLIHFFENLDEDRMSVCINGQGEEKTQQIYSVRYNSTPRMFTNTTWTLRAKWWLNRHFSRETLEKDTEKGDWEMMSYKAACASHIYGREFSYVTKVYGLLEKHINNDDTASHQHTGLTLDLFNFLRTHRRNWNIIYNLNLHKRIE